MCHLVLRLAGVFLCRLSIDPSVCVVHVIWAHRCWPSEFWRRRRHTALQKLLHVDKMNLSERQKEEMWVFCRFYFSKVKNGISKFLQNGYFTYWYRIFGIFLQMVAQIGIFCWLNEISQFYICSNFIKIVFDFDILMHKNGMWIWDLGK